MAYTLSLAKLKERLRIRNLLVRQCLAEFLGSHLQDMDVPRLGVNLEPQPQQLGIRATSATYTTAHSNARSLTH